jgi:hypothetical protein
MNQESNHGIAARVRMLAGAGVAALLLTTGTPVTHAEGAAKASHEDTREAGAIPGWLREEMQYLAKGTGRWVASNRPHRSAEEPWDAYLLEWRWGVGKNNLVGRLSGLQGKTEGTLFWEYRLFWHPGEKRAVIYQFGWDGTFGTGELRAAGDAKKTELEQVFHRPDGTSWEGRHESANEPDTHTTRSFIRSAGAWRETRVYVWKRG